MKTDKIKLVASDIDGVWTDARMYYNSDGDFMKSFSTYDGMAVKLLREANLPLVIMTGEDTEMVSARAKKLGIEHVYQGQEEKLDCMNMVCKQFQIKLSEVAYIGDDINDLDVLKAVGLSGVPLNNRISNQFKPDFVTPHGGGDGAFRDFVDFILLNR